MDVKSLGQGGQNAFEFNYGTNNLNSSSNSNSSNNSNVDSQYNTQNMKTQINKSENSTNLENKKNKANAYEKSELHQKQIKEQDVKIATDKLNKLFEGTNTHVEYERVGKFQTMSIKIIDGETHEVIKELPPRKIIEMIDKLCELAGIMVDEKA